MTNVGIDFMAFNNRLSLTADYYVKNTKDILLTVPIPISSGGANEGADLLTLHEELNLSNT